MSGAEAQRAPALSEQGNRLLRVYRTVHKMLHDRGYLIGSEALSMTKEQARPARSPTPRAPPCMPARRARRRLIRAPRRASRAVR